MATNEKIIGALRKDIELIRGETPMLFDKNSDAYYKLNNEIVTLLAFLNEAMPISKFIEKLSKNGIEIEENELIKVVSFLQSNNLLEPVYGQVEAKREQITKIRKNTRFLQLACSLLFFRLPPWRPENLFNKITPYISWLASKWLILTLAIISFLGYIVAIKNFSQIRELFLDTLSWSGLVKYLGVIIFIKIIHESAHSIAAIHLKCRVRGIGVGFMLFYPRLYTDVTDSWRLPCNKRILIDGAGLIIELIIGGIAALLWSFLTPGALQSTMFYVFTVSTLSTLVVNGNPFIRYDGYYILCDLLKIENLLSRSNEYIKQSARWYILKLGAKPTSKYGLFLSIYGILSFIYRIFLYTSIIAVIYLKFTKILAIIILAIELYAIIFYPLYREIKIIKALSKKSASKASLIFLLIILITIACVLFIPLKWSFKIPGEVVPQNSSNVIIQESGYLQTPFPKRAIKVAKNEQIIKLTSPQLNYAIERLNHILNFDKMTLNLQQLDNRYFINSDITKAKIKSTKLSLDELIRRQNNLVLKSTNNSIFVPEFDNISSGAFFPKGLIIGKLVTPECKIYAFANDNQIGKLAVGMEAKAYLSDDLKSYKIIVSKINSIANNLHDSPLLASYGGPIPVYFSQEKSNEYASMEQLYCIELKFIEKPKIFSGRLVEIKFIKSEQLYRNIMNFLISIFRKEF